MEKFADKVEIEEFSLSPKAFMGWVAISGLFVILSIAFSALNYFGTLPDFELAFNVVSAVLSGFAMLFIISEFVLYKELLDPLYKKGTSCNVVCVREATGEAKRRIIFSGHMDSAHEWRFHHLGGAKLLRFIVGYGIGGGALCLVLAIISFFPLSDVMELVFFVVRCAMLPGAFLVMFYVNWNRCVDGAIDDLSGVYSAAGVMQFLGANNIRFENTEVVVLSTGSEEAGLRGAKKYAERHGEELKKIDTVFVALDPVYDLEKMGINLKDMSGHVVTDGSAARLLKTAAENAGYDVPFATVTFGATDAAAMQQAGISSTSISAIDQSPDRVYHTRRDNVNALKFEAIEVAVAICIEATFDFDAN